MSPEPESRVSAILSREAELWDMARLFLPALESAYRRTTRQPPPDPPDVRHMVSAILNAEFPPRE